MYNYKQILDYILIELVVNVEFWNIIILWIMLSFSIEMTFSTERKKKKNFIKFLDKIGISLFKTQALVFLLQLLRITIIMIVDCNVLEFLYLSAIFFCIYVIWLFFILIVYNEIKNKRDYIRVNLLEFEIILIISVILLYNFIMFSIRIYF